MIEQIAISNYLDHKSFIAAALAGIFGGIVRGYSGFGFTLAAMPILTITISPIVAVPAVFPLELLIGLLTLPMERKYVDLTVLKWLALGAFIGTPIGITILVLVPNDVMRLLIGLAVSVAVIRAWRQDDTDAIAATPLHLSSIGFLSGCLNGGTGMSGPPVIVSLLGSNMPTLSARATLIAFVAMSACFGFVMSFAHGSYSREVWLLTVTIVPAAAVGSAIGIYIFSMIPKKMYRAVSLGLLGIAMIISIGTIAWSFIGKMVQ